MMTSSRIIFLSALLGLAANAFADDAPSDQPVKSPKQRMHDCMAQQHQQNPSLSKDELKKQCAQIMQSLDNHPSVPPSQTPPQPRS
jgi:hypothetical protein